MYVIVWLFVDNNYEYVIFLFCFFQKSTLFQTLRAGWPVSNSAFQIGQMND